MTNTETRTPVHVYAFGLCYLSVCAPLGLTPDEVTAEVNRCNTTGLDHGWSIADEPFKDGDPNPTPCEHDSLRRHFLFSC